MSTTASQTLPRTPSSSRRNPSYSQPAERVLSSPTSSRANIPPSPTSSRANVPSTPRRTSSNPSGNGTTHGRSSSAAQGQLSHVAQRDEERLNLAGTRQTDDASKMSRSQSVRNPMPSLSRPKETPRYDPPRPITATTPIPPPNANPNGLLPDDKSKQSSNEPAQPRRRTNIEAKTGNWELGKTIGAGSMGKVKLARNKDTNEQAAVKIVPRGSTDEHKTVQERERAERSKEVRTAREAAIVTLVDHPYICGMKDVLRTRHHWYMLFEYVNGGQMLDYIISHGRLKEKQARKFGRQIASALDYCHRNSIVHRDLKIENILISKTGDIKIIDFGLSNTFSPKGHLKTFCGSLYFAAPELLQAKQYTGPEVDVWSFGIVLYVLVCGKVPFDDQSMPQLHAKIKKGVVEYPPWLSNECRSLISRMLVTDPLARATMSEIMTHPWMTKGFGGSPDNYLPPRKPLTLPLDRDVIRKMDGFDFGAASSIEEALIKTVESEDYQRAVRLYEKRNSMNTPEAERKRGVFDFYKRRNSLSRDTLNNSSEAVNIGQDPVNAYSPLLSIYYLAKEKIDRERKDPNPGALAMPKSPGEKPPLELPELRAPAAAYTNPTAYELAGEDTGGRARPRARTHGEDEVAEEAAKAKKEAAPSPKPPQVILPPPEQTPTRKESVTGGLLRRLSTRRHGKSDSERQPPPAVNVQAPADAGGVGRKSFSMRRRESSNTAGEALLSPSHAQAQKEQQQEYLSPKQPSPPNEAAKKRVGLGRSTSVNSGDFRRCLSRRGVSEGSSMKPPATPPMNQRPSFDVQTPSADAASDIETPKTAPPAVRTKSLGHARRESIQKRRAERAQVRTANVPEETDAELAGEEQDDEEEDEGAAGDVSGGSPGGMKPVFLKGLFSVSTTSSKPFKVIESDIIRVLKQLGIDYQSNGKGGFKCRHSPSINLPKGQEEEKQPVSTSISHRRKISFSLGLSRGQEPEESAQRTAPQTPNSFRSNRRDQSEDEESPEEGDAGVSARQRRRYSPNTPQAAGETTTHVQHDVGSNMMLRFEIFVVKVPLLSFHGIQFKKLDGNTWQYKNMAQTILNELRL